MTQIKSPAADVDDREIRGEIFLTQNASVRFRRGLRKLREKMIDIAALGAAIRMFPRRKKRCRSPDYSN